MPRIDARDGTQLQLSGFLVINPANFDKLPDNVFAGSWRRTGMVGAGLCPASVITPLAEHGRYVAGTVRMILLRHALVLFFLLVTGYAHAAA